MIGCSLYTSVRYEDGMTTFKLFKNVIKVVTLTMETVVDRYSIWRHIMAKSTLQSLQAPH